MKFAKMACVLMLMLVAQALHAQGITMVQQETRNGKSTTSQIQLDKTHMRAESQASGSNSVFLFDATSRTARIVDVDKKTYTQLDASQMQQMQQALAQMQEQMKNMPPQQRAMMEQMMRGRGGMPGMGAPVTPIQYKQTGSDKVGQWSCTKYDGFRGTDKVAEICTVDPKDLGVTPADFEVAKQFAEYLKGLIPQAAEQVTLYGSAEQGFTGVPVRRTQFANGKVDSVSELKEVRREAIPSSAWEVPSGFTRQQFGGQR